MFSVTVLTKARRSVSFRSVKEFQENLERLKRWFPNIKFSSTENFCYYTLDIGNGLSASATLYVGKDDFLNTYSVSSSEWLIKVNSYENECYHRHIPAAMCEHRGSFSVWAKQVQTDSLLKYENVDLLATFMSLFWIEVFERSIKSYGLITGSWVSGVILV